MILDVLSWINSRNPIKYDNIPCQYSVMEAILVKWYLLKLPRYQLPKITVFVHLSVAPKLIVVWTPVCIETDQFQEYYQT